MYKPHDQGFVSQSSQAEMALELMKKSGLMRASEFRAKGISAATLSRLSANGIIVRLSRGLYQLAGAPIEADHTLAEVAKKVPKAVICLLSALSYYELTNTRPQYIWLAIGHKDWAPKIDVPAIRVARFSNQLMNIDINHTTVGGVDIKVFSPVRTVVDLFRHERLVGLPLAIEGLKNLLRTRGATVTAIAEKAQALGVSKKMKPYLEVLASDV